MEKKRKEVFNKIAEIISDITEVDATDITEDSYCFSELGIESFDIVDLNFSIEEIFEVEVDENSFWNIRELVQNPDFFTEDEYLTAKGIEEVKRRIPGIKVSGEAEKEGKMLFEDVFNAVQVKHIVDFIISKKMTP